MIVFEVPGIPVAQHRPRFSTHGGFPRAYSAKTDVLYRVEIQRAYNKMMSKAPSGNGIVFNKPMPLKVTLLFRMPIPSSWSAKKRMDAITHRLMPITKPDIDNLEKAIFDGLNGLAWEDDSQVVEVQKRKCYSMAPGVQVTIDEWILPR